MLNPHFLVDDETSLGQALCNWFQNIADRSLREREQFSLCVPGGSVAQRLLPAFAAARVDWRRVHIFFGDERAVPLDHDESNYNLVQRSLLSRIPLPPQNVHPMRADREPLSAACDEYELLLKRMLGEPPALDLALLGVGSDGHTCSLFPGHEDEERGHLVAVVRDSPKPPSKRMTLTYQALALARLVAVLALGRGKAEILARAVADPSLPVHRVLRDAREAWLIADRAAASSLPGAESAR